MIAKALEIKYKTLSNNYLFDSINISVLKELGCYLNRMDFWPTQ